MSSASESFAGSALFIEDLDQVAPSLQRRLAALLLRLQEKAAGAPASRVSGAQLAWLFTASQPHGVVPALRHSCTAVRLPLPSVCELACRFSGEAREGREDVRGEATAAAGPGVEEMAGKGQEERTGQQEGTQRERRELERQTEGGYSGRECAESLQKPRPNSQSANFSSLAAARAASCSAAGASSLLHLLARETEQCPFSVFLSLFRARRGDPAAEALLHRLLCLSAQRGEEPSAGDKGEQGGQRKEEREKDTEAEREEREAGTGGDSERGAGSEPRASEGTGQEEEGDEGKSFPSCPWLEQKKRWQSSTCSARLSGSGLSAKPVNERIGKIAQLLKSTKCSDRSWPALRHLWHGALQQDNLFRTRNADALLLELMRAFLHSSAKPCPSFASELIHLLADTSWEIARGEFAVGAPANLELCSLRASRLYHANRARLRASLEQQGEKEEDEAQEDAADGEEVGEEADEMEEQTSQVDERGLENSTPWSSGQDTEMDPERSERKDGRMQVETTASPATSERGETTSDIAGAVSLFDRDD
ncbi:conserved hypothetical protein [Neospora caninum Liverpool]|nr:conserved hypothetical protein [Neospora caninum Liverpool]CBZ51989.1 conserved hypothetical protein [Neospora caninum Liverpool]|eukprot:XP_003882022.1 conserved hypothetical protein [Neospora caninum Liverpool]